jgi:ATP-dependent helicase HrpB
MEREEVDRVLARAAEEAREIRWEGTVPKGLLVRRVGRLLLTERPAKPLPEEIAASFLQHLQKQGLSLLPWNARSQALLARLRFSARQRPEAGLEQMSEEWLVRNAEEWLVPFLTLSGSQVISAGDLLRALQSVARKVSTRFDSELPEWLVLPTGGKRAIDYEGEAPSVEARIQEVFGLARSPRVLGVPVAFRLLSPARRPVQITSDLASFWRSTYADVRKEMRGRYPKHYWPEDPLQAEPTSRVRPRKKES